MFIVLLKYLKKSLVLRHYANVWNNTYPGMSMTVVARVNIPKRKYVIA
jgi:hypothetical protein